MSAASDERPQLYADLHGRQMSGEEAQNRHSAHVILEMLFTHFHPQSVLDVGCGLGTWLEVAREMGVSEVRGVEGSWLDRSKLAIGPDLVELIDLEQPFSLNRKFDLVICLEVAEHLSHPASEGFVSSLAAHADVVLFSAAIPFQGGHHHVNEQFPGYWNERFAQHGFRWIDLVRPTIWQDANILWWLRQNTILFAHDRFLDAHPKLKEMHNPGGLLSIVHPEIYVKRIQMLRRALGANQALIQTISEGGRFEITAGPNNVLNVKKI